VWNVERVNFHPLANPCKERVIPLFLAQNRQQVDLRPGLRLCLGEVENNLLRTTQGGRGHDMQYFHEYPVCCVTSDAKTTIRAPTGPATWPLTPFGSGVSLRTGQYPSDRRRGALLPVAGFILVGVTIIVAAGLVISFWWVPGGHDRVAQVLDLDVGEPGVFSAHRDRQIDRISVRRVHDGRIYGVEDHFLFVSDDMGETFQRRGSIPKWEPTLADHLKNAVARHPLTRRIRQARGPTSIVVLESGTILMFYDLIYRSEDGGWTFEALARPADDFYPPFPHGVAVDAEGRVFFGDYRTDSRPHEVRVYRGTRDGTEWEVCHTFESGHVFHVHGVAHDLVEDQVLVFTGDRDEESAMFRLDPECGGVEAIGGGYQAWRLISPVFLPDAMIWGNDDDVHGSGIFRFDRATGSLSRIHEIGKPSYHATILADGTIALSTTYEPGSVFTRQENPEPTTEIWISAAGSGWHLLDTFLWEEGEEVWGPSRAVARLPSSDGSIPYLFVTALATTEGFVTYRYSIDWEPE